MSIADIAVIQGSGQNRCMITQNTNWVVPMGVHNIWITACAAGEDGSASDPNYIAKAGEFVLEEHLAVHPGQVIPITVGAGNTVIGEYYTLMAGVLEGEWENSKLGYTTGLHGYDFSGKGGYGGAFGIGGVGGGRGGDEGGGGTNPGVSVHWENGYAQGLYMAGAKGGAYGANGQTVYYPVVKVTVGGDGTKVEGIVVSLAFKAGWSSASSGVYQTADQISFGGIPPSIDAVEVSRKIDTTPYILLRSSFEELYHLGGRGEKGEDSTIGTISGYLSVTPGNGDWKFSITQQTSTSRSGRGGAGGKGGNAINGQLFGAGGGSCGAKGNGTTGGAGGDRSKGAPGMALIEW